MQSENDLIKGCQEYNIKAQEALYRLYSRKMNAVCYRYMGNAEDAEDVLHEGFIKVFAKIGQYKGDGSFEGWIKRIMANTAIDSIKKRNNLQEIFALNADHELEFHSVSEDNDEAETNYHLLTQDELLIIVNELPKDYRIIFTLFCLEGFSHKEIGEKLEISEATCRSKLRRARAMLRVYLEKVLRGKSI